MDEVIAAARQVVNKISANTFTIHGISFSLPEGKRMAIIGPSGSGKTIVVNLLMRFWDYSEGRIVLGGEDLRHLLADDVRSVISLVSQRTRLFNASILDNLLLADPGAEMDAIEKAAKHARVHDFILSLPAGYDTRIGEQGARLSGGERQRLAIARAPEKRSDLDSRQASVQSGCLV